MIKYFTKLFNRNKKNKYIYTQIEHTNNDIENKQDNIKVINSINSELWIPDDELYNKYINFNDKLNQKNKLINEIKKLNIKKDSLKTSHNIIITENPDVIECIEHIEYINQLLAINDEIKIAERKLNDLKTFDFNIPKLWIEYLEKANNFLIERDLLGFISTNDIISTSSIQILIRKINDRIYFGKDSQKDDNKKLLEHIKNNIFLDNAINKNKLIETLPSSIIKNLWISNNPNNNPLPYNFNNMVYYSK